MDATKLGELFVRLTPSLRELVRVPRGVTPDDALHEALVYLLDHFDEVAEDVEQAEADIRRVVVKVSKAHRHRRITERVKFPPPQAWVRETRHVMPPSSDGVEDEGVDPIVLIPDTRLGPEEELLEKERQQQLRALAGIAARSPLARLVWLEGKTPKEAAALLGLSWGNVRQRLVRLKKELRDSLKSLK